MATHQAEIIAFGKGNIHITFYDNSQNPTDSENFGGVKSGQYRWSVSFFRNDVKKYGFTLKNDGFLSVLVRWKDQEFDFTSKANHQVIDFWNQNSYAPKSTDASRTQHVGNVYLLQQP